MLLIITYDNGRPHGLGRGSFIVDDATRELAQRIQAARKSSPDEVLTIPNARIHATAGAPGTASIRAGHIVEVKED